GLISRRSEIAWPGKTDPPNDWARLTQYPPPAKPVGAGPSMAPAAKSPSQNRARNPLPPVAYLTARMASHACGRRLRRVHSFGLSAVPVQMRHRPHGTRHSRHARHSAACFRFTIAAPFPLVPVGRRTRDQEQGVPAMNPANLPFDSEAMLQGLRHWV